MPELPEVETIKNEINQKTPFEILGIQSSEYLKSFIAPSLIKKLKNKTITHLTRHGKKIFFHTPDIIFFSHLGMSGAWIFSKEEPTEKHFHLKLKSKEFWLSYYDPRRFGAMQIFSLKDFETFHQALPIDLVSPLFTHSHLKKILSQKKKSVIKSLLLDQNYFPGCGNYMASEICALANILPTTLCGDIKNTQKLLKAILNVTLPAIQNGGVTFQSGYKNTQGERGDGVKGLVVFHQKICGICKKSNVEKIIINTRMTYYCPSCQK